MFEALSHQSVHSSILCSRCRLLVTSAIFVIFHFHVCTCMNFFFNLFYFFLLLMFQTDTEIVLFYSHGFSKGCFISFLRNYFVCLLSPLYCFNALDTVFMISNLDWRASFTRSYTKSIL